MKQQDKCQGNCVRKDCHYNRNETGGEEKENEKNKCHLDLNFLLSLMLKTLLMINGILLVLYLILGCRLVKLAMCRNFHIIILLENFSLWFIGDL